MILHLRSYLCFEKLLNEKPTALATNFELCIWTCTLKDSWVTYTTEGSQRCRNCNLYQSWGDHFKENESVYVVLQSDNLNGAE